MTSSARRRAGIDDAARTRCGGPSLDRAHRNRVIAPSFRKSRARPRLGQRDVPWESAPAPCGARGAAAARRASPGAGGQSRRRGRQHPPLRPGPGGRTARCSPTTRSSSSTRPTSSRTSSPRHRGRRAQRRPARGHGGRRPPGPVEADIVTEVGDMADASAGCSATHRDRRLRPSPDDVAARSRSPAPASRRSSPS